MRQKPGSGKPCVELEVTLELPQFTGPARKEQAPAPVRERNPRVTRLVALAVKYKGMVDGGELRDYADIARLGYVSRARITQIMNLSNLAPDIQEALLFPAGDVPPERRLRGVVAEVDWGVQRRRWRELIKAQAACFQ